MHILTYTRNDFERANLRAILCNIFLWFITRRASEFSDDECVQNAEDLRYESSGSKREKEKVRRDSTSGFDAFKSAVTEAVRTSTLGAGLGMETPEERFARIENRVVVLEEEKRALTDILKKSLGEVATLFGTISEELSCSLEETSQSIDSNSGIIKSIMMQVVTTNATALSEAVEIVKSLRDKLESVVVEEDLKDYVENFLKIVNETADDKFQAVELPSMPLFEPIISEIVEEERKKIKKAMGMDIGSSGTQVSPPRPQTSQQDTLGVSNSSISSTKVSTKSEEECHNSLGLIGSASGERDDSQDSSTILSSVSETVGYPNGHALEAGENGALFHSGMFPHVNSENSSGEGKSKSMFVEDLEPELMKFGVPPGEKVIESYSCAIYPKRGLLTHGRMYVTKNFLCFSGWPEIKVMLDLSQIASVDRTNSVIFIANCVRLTTNDGVEYSFGSFLDRDHCYNLLKNMVEVKKGVYEVMNPTLASGLSSPVNTSRGVSISMTSESGDNNTFSETSEKVESPFSVLEDSSNARVENASTLKEGHLESRSEIKNVEINTSTVNFSELLKKHDIFSLCEESFSFSVSRLMNLFWEKGEGWKTFLENEGDLDIEYGEWNTYAECYVAEDPCKFPYQYSRLVSYAHPRTTMLMFGPKNAPAMQSQYLHVIEGTRVAPSKFVVLTVTQFDGIPMADTFKVVQYWCYEQCTNECITRVGVTVHFMKSTMFKSQVISGVRNELKVAVKQWCNYIDNLINKSEDDLSAAVAEALTDGLNSRRSSGIGRRSSRTMQEIVNPIISETINEMGPKSFWTLQNILIFVLLIVMITLLRQNFLLHGRFDKLEESLKRISQTLEAADSFR